MPSYYCIRDRFNRVDNTDPNSNFPGTNWIQTIHSGFPASHDIVSNRLIPAVSTGGWCSDYWKDSFGVDQAAQITIPTSFTAGAFRICMRMANPGVDATVTHYEFETDGGNSYIVRVDPTYARTTLLTTGVGFTAGDVMRVECRANTLWLFKNGTEIGYDEDETYIRAGYIGLMCAGVTGATFDDFWAGDLGGPYYPQLSSLDDFERGNGDPGTNWSTAFVATPAKPTIDTFVLKSGSGSSANSGMYWDSYEVPDGEVNIQLLTLPSPTTEAFYLAFRAMNTARNGPPPDSTSWSGYQVMWEDGFIILRKYDGTSATVLYTSPSGWTEAIGSFGVSFYGDEITVYYRPQTSNVWSRFGEPVTDATYSGGYIGLEFDEATARVTNFAGGKHADLSSYATAVMALEPTSYWRLDDNNTNDIGSSHRKLFRQGTTTPTNSIVPVEMGAANGAFVLNGSAALQTPDSASYNFQDPSPDWSINWWQMHTDTAFGTGFQRMFEKRDVNGNNRGYLYYGQGATYDSSFDVDPGAAAPEGIGMDSNFILGQAHMVTVTFEASTGTARFYVDAVQISSKTNWTFEADLFPHNGAEFTIGSDSGLFGNRFVGTMDDWSIWDGRLLSDAEILALWEAGQAPERQTLYVTRRRFVRR